MNRFDRIGFLAIPETDKDREELGLIQKFTKDPSGKLKGAAAVTNVGVFAYRLPDGRVRKELRPPEEVFKEDSLKSLSLAPLTNNHPAEPVTPENAAKYMVGSLGDTIKRDELHVYAPISVTAASAIEAVLNGKRALSCGYSADLEEKSGVWCGVPYDAIQRNIQYNHVAIVDVGRAGDAVTMRLDSAGIELLSALDSEEEEDEYTKKLLAESDDLLKDETPKTTKKDSAMKTVRIDGVEYEAEAAVITALKLTNDKLDAAEAEKETLSTELETASAKLDSATDKLDQAEAKIQELEAQLANTIKADQLDTLVAQRLQLLSYAKQAGVEVKADASEMDIKKSIIMKASPKADLADKSETYLTARFDAAVELLALRKEDQAAQKMGKKVAEVDPEVEDEEEEEMVDGKPMKKDSADAARRRMVQQLQTGWQN